jgi:hypothetical protein
MPKCAENARCAYRFVLVAEDVDLNRESRAECLILKLAFRCNRTKNIQIMKLATFVRLSILIGTAGLCSYGLAGPASSSEPAQPDSDQAGVIAPATQIPSGVSPGLNARVTALLVSPAPRLNRRL